MKRQREQHFKRAKGATSQAGPKRSIRIQEAVDLVERKARLFLTESPLITQRKNGVDSIASSSRSICCRQTGSEKMKKEEEKTRFLECKRRINENTRSITTNLT